VTVSDERNKTLTTTTDTNRKATGGNSRRNNFDVMIFGLSEEEVSCFGEMQDEDDCMYNDSAHREGRGSGRGKGGMKDGSGGSGNGRGKKLRNKHNFHIKPPQSGDTVRKEYFSAIN
jgi:hypothetical protein